MAIPGVRKSPFVFKELHINTPYPNSSIKNIDCTHRVKHECAVPSSSPSSGPPVTATVKLTLTIAMSNWSNILAI